VYAWHTFGHGRLEQVYELSNKNLTAAAAEWIAHKASTCRLAAVNKAAFQWKQL
jgi:hypothetical protein